MSMRGAAVAVVEYLLGFVALALFAWLAFGRGPVSDDRFVRAFEIAGGVALVELAILLARATPANRLVIGANVWLVAGAAAALTEQWWLLRLYQHYGEASLFAAMLVVGVLSTALSEAGFVARRGPRPAVLKASMLLLAGVALALWPAIHFSGDVRYAAVLPVVALSWLGRLLRRSVPDVR